VQLLSGKCAIKSNGANFAQTKPPDWADAPGENLDICAAHICYEPLPIQSAGDYLARASKFEAFILYCAAKPPASHGRRTGMHPAQTCGEYVSERLSFSPATGLCCHLVQLCSGELHGKPERSVVFEYLEHTRLNLQPTNDVG
jgi:hypothetical protein